MQQQQHNLQRNNPFLLSNMQRFNSGQVKVQAHNLHGGQGQPQRFNRLNSENTSRENLNQGESNEAAHPFQMNAEMRLSTLILKPSKRVRQDSEKLAERIVITESNCKNLGLRLFGNGNSGGAPHHNTNTNGLGILGQGVAAGQLNSDQQNLKHAAQKEESKIGLLPSNGLLLDSAIANSGQQNIQHQQLMSKLKASISSHANRFGLGLLNGIATTNPSGDQKKRYAFSGGVRLQLRSQKKLDIFQQQIEGQRGYSQRSVNHDEQEIGLNHFPNDHLHIRTEQEVREMFERHLQQVFKDLCIKEDDKGYEQREVGFTNFSNYTSQTDMSLLICQRMFCLMSIKSDIQQANNNQLYPNCERPGAQQNRRVITEEKFVEVFRSIFLPYEGNKLSDAQLDIVFKILSPSATAVLQNEGTSSGNTGKMLKKMNQIIKRKDVEIILNHLLTSNKGGTHEQFANLYIEYLIKAKNQAEDIKQKEGNENNQKNPFTNQEEPEQKGSHNKNNVQKLFSTQNEQSNKNQMSYVDKKKAAVEFLISNIFTNNNNLGDSMSKQEFLEKLKIDEKQETPDRKIVKRAQTEDNSKQELQNNVSPIEEQRAPSPLKIITKLLIDYLRIFLPVSHYFEITIVKELQKVIETQSIYSPEKNNLGEVIISPEKKAALPQLQNKLAELKGRMHNQSIKFNQQIEKLSIGSDAQNQPDQLPMILLSNVQDSSSRQQNVFAKPITYFSNLKLHSQKIVHSAQNQGRESVASFQNQKSYDTGHLKRVSLREIDSANGEQSQNEKGSAGKSSRMQSLINLKEESKSGGFENLDVSHIKQNEERGCSSQSREPFQEFRQKENSLNNYEPRRPSTKFKFNFKQPGQEEKKLMQLTKHVINQKEKETKKHSHFKTRANKSERIIQLSNIRADPNMMDSSNKQDNSNERGQSGYMNAGEILSQSSFQSSIQNFNEDFEENNCDEPQVNLLQTPKAIKMRSNYARMRNLKFIESNRDSAVIMPENDDQSLFSRIFNQSQMNFPRGTAGIFRGQGEIGNFNWSKNSRTLSVFQKSNISSNSSNSGAPNSNKEMFDANLVYEMRHSPLYQREEHKKRRDSLIVEQHFFENHNKLEEHNPQLSQQITPLSIGHSNQMDTLKIKPSRMKLAGDDQLKKSSHILDRIGNITRPIMLQNMRCFTGIIRKPTAGVEVVEEPYIILMRQREQQRIVQGYNSQRIKVYYQRGKKKIDSIDNKQQYHSLYLQIQGPDLFAYIDRESQKPLFTHSLGMCTFTLEEEINRPQSAIQSKDAAQNKKADLQLDIPSFGGKQKQILLIEEKKKSEDVGLEMSGPQKFKPNQDHDKNFKWKINIDLNKNYKRKFYANNFDKANDFIRKLNESKELLKPHPCFEDRFILTTESLGEGSFGKVYVGKDLKHVGQKVAVKVIDKSKMSEKELRFIREELETMRVLNDHFTWSSTNGSRGIVKLIDIFEDQTTIKIVQELVNGGSLFKWVINEHKSKNYPEEISREIFGKLAQSLQFMNSLGFMHRDIKLENILLRTKDEKNIEPVYIDFGLSTALLSSQYRRELVGSVAFISPEVAQGKQHDLSTDVWSLGIVLYALLTGRLPFLASQRETTLKSIIEKSINYEQPCWQNVSPQAKCLVQAMLQKDPRERIALTEVLIHPWLQVDKQ